MPVLGGVLAASLRAEGATSVRPGPCGVSTPSAELSTFGEVTSPLAAIEVGEELLLISFFILCEVTSPFLEVTSPLPPIGEVGLPLSVEVTSPFVDNIGEVGLLSTDLSTSKDNVLIDFASKVIRYVSLVARP